MKQLIILAACILFFASCDHHNRPEKKSTVNSLLSADTGSAKKEILAIDKEFSVYSVSIGIKDAFDKYMSDNGVYLKTNHMPIESKDSVVAFMGKKKIKDVKITRTPTLVDVSQSGDLAYLYGIYEASGTGPKGNAVSSKGSYITVWKKNKEGNWEMVLDCENEGLVPVKKSKK
ncbi:MAG: nuclear transport factor 2 family protein [Bacteroidota bacterium]